MTLPNFFIIGAAKSGTTALYHYLKQHPQIFMSQIKETNFFSYKEKIEYSNGPGDKNNMQGSVGDIQDYLALFEGSEQYIARGEASVTYLDTELVSKRIKSHIPEAKIIVILRNPVDRAYASFMHLRRDGREPYADFSHALQEEENRVRQKWSFLFHYKTRQFTYRKLKRYFDTFDKERIKVYLYDDWKNDNSSILKDIFCFLDVDENFSPDISIKHNAGALPKKEGFHNFFAKQNYFKNLFKPLMPLRLRRRIKNRLMNMNFERQPLSPDIRKELIEVYHEDILKVQELIQKDISHWLIVKKNDTT
ncbi:MAG: sulfotransferase [Candidatus Omnitrophica bacterium]|nr:sulfotransferase [Candidatus Omnitrophota bacterium]